MHQTEGILRPNRVSGAEAKKSTDLDDEPEMLHQLPFFSHSSLTCLNPVAG